MYKKSGGTPKRNPKKVAKARKRGAMKKKYAAGKRPNKKSVKPFSKAVYKATKTKR